MDTQFKDFIGLTLNKEIEEKIKTVGNYRSSRILHPDSMMTMDYRTDRVNIYVNQKDVITKVTIG